MTRPTPEPTPKPARRVVRLNRRARALAEVEALGIDLRDPFASLTDPAAPELDSLIYGRDFAAFL